MSRIRLTPAMYNEAAERLWEKLAARADQFDFSGVNLNVSNPTTVVQQAFPRLVSLVEEVNAEKQCQLTVFDVMWAISQARQGPVRMRQYNQRHGRTIQPRE